MTNPDGGVPFLTAGAGDGAARPVPADAAGGPSSFHMTAAVTGAAQRLAAGARAPVDRRGDGVLLGAPAARRAERAYEIRYALDFLDAAPRTATRADAALDGAAPARSRPTAGCRCRRHRGRGAAAARARRRGPDRPIRALFDADAVERALDAIAAGQRDDGGWDFDWLHWDPAVAWETRGRLTVDASRCRSRTRGR